MKEATTSSSVSSFTSIAVKLDSRIFPYRCGDKILSTQRCQRFIADLQGDRIRNELIDSVSKKYPDYTYGVPVFVDSSFFGISVSPEMEDNINMYGGFPETPCLRTTKGITYLFRHPVFPLNHRVYTPDGIWVITDNQYLLIPGPTRLSTDSDWIISPEDMDFANLPAWATKWVLPIRESLIEESTQMLDMFIREQCTIGPYEYHNTSDFWKLYGIYSEQNGVKKPEYTKIVQQLNARGFITALVNRTNVFRGISWKED